MYRLLMKSPILLKSPGLALSFSTKNSSPTAEKMSLSIRETAFRLRVVASGSAAYAAPIRAPMEVPAIHDSFIPFSPRTSRIPM